ncbi:hypothetical protein [Paracoccus salsus]|uniref:hypothetical protein n=1 Tax=Paracoccus salsus TaxID=2911061 RepID=UPI001F226B6B|nr:hypothetical protein [Paracoccus salsus]MCF3973957.1 hypothetical protein [Paracoccus salsus]
MKVLYRPDLKGHVRVDDANRVRAIRHSQEYWESPVGGGLTTAVRYLRELAQVYEIPSTRLNRLATQVAFLDPKEQGEEYRLSEEKRMFDSETFGFYQTYLNVPVWRAGLKVTVKQGPNRVVHSEDSSQSGVDATLPPSRVIKKFQALFGDATAASISRRALRAQADLRDTKLRAAVRETGETDSAGESFLKSVLKFTGDGEDRTTDVRMIRGRFWIYRYDAAERLPEGDPDQPVIREDETPPPRRRSRPKASGREVHTSVPLPFDVPPVSDKIEDGRYYMVGEVTFEVTAGDDKTVWRALIELESNSILYLRPLVAHVNGLVFEQDPITSSGTTTPTSASNNATLNPHRDDVLLQNLDAPVAGTQSLRGTFAEVTQVEGPNIAAPTQGSGADFDYDTRTNNFASVSGYFHVDRIFRTMQDLGFNVSTYMANTNFPVPVDIRCFDAINAHCVGDGMGGIGHTGYGLMDTTDTTNPLGRACDPRVHLHEVLGHGILYEAVDSPNMGFVHSAGDSLSLIYSTPNRSAGASMAHRSANPVICASPTCLGTRH